MFDGIRYFFNLLGVEPFWPVTIILLSFLTCISPYRPVAKIKETEDNNGKKTYTVYHYRDK